jgi:hypothetical protein
VNLHDAGWTLALAADFAARGAGGLEPARVAAELNHIYRI